MSEPPLKRKRTILDYFGKNDKGKSKKMTSVADSKSSTASKGTSSNEAQTPVNASTCNDNQVNDTIVIPDSVQEDEPNTTDGVTDPINHKKASDNDMEAAAGPSENSETLQYSPLLFTDSEVTDSQESVPEIPERKPSQRQSNCIWRGVPLPTLNSKPGCMKPLPPLKADDKHCVLYKTSFKYNGKQHPAPHPSQYKDVWDPDHVRMPCSHMNEYPVKDKDGKSVVKRRWTIIEQALTGNIPGPFELEEAILKYNTRYTDKWNFETLNHFFLDEISREERIQFFDVTLKKIVTLALMLPHLITQPIPLLKKNKNKSITLSQQQIASLLANAFFCTFPRRNAKQRSSEFNNYPSINFNSLFEGFPVKKKLEKLKCIMHYFRRVTADTPKGTVTFERQCIPHDKFPDWSNLETKLTELHVSAEGTIEDDGEGMLQVDFANKMLGGGVLGQGCVQEEIRFLICPEMLVTRLFTECLEKNESLIMYGCERFSKYDGYAQTFKWDGDFVDKTHRDDWGRLCTDVVAIDALVIREHGRQFKMDQIRRELNKAYCGFVSPGIKAEFLSAVCTGNWGCGAFGGDKRLKALIQLIAASYAKRDVCYLTFDDKTLRDELFEIHQYLTKTNPLGIGNILTLIQQYEKNVVSRKPKKSKYSVNLYQYIPRVFDGTLEMTDSEPDTPTWDDSDSNETRYMLANQDSMEAESTADQKEKESTTKGDDSVKTTIQRQESKDYKADTP